MSKTQKLNYFPLSSNVHFCHFLCCSGHKQPISDVLSYHLLFEILCCAIAERHEICNRCNSCFFCARTDNLIREFNDLDKVNTAANDLYWSKVALDLSRIDSFGHILGIEKISTSREIAEKLKLV